MWSKNYHKLKPNIHTNAKNKIQIQLILVALRIMQMGNITKSKSKTNLLSTIPDQKLQNNPSSSKLVEYLQSEIEVQNIKKINRKTENFRGLRWYRRQRS